VSVSQNPAVLRGVPEKEEPKFQGFSNKVLEEPKFQGFSNEVLTGTGRTGVSRSL
jgi:hypothetical protein